MRRKVLRESATSRLLEEQLVVVAVPGSGKKNNDMWHVPQYALFCGFWIICVVYIHIYSMKSITACSLKELPALIFRNLVCFKQIYV